jgi:hypothetical protein
MEGPLSLDVLVFVKTGESGGKGWWLCWTERGIVPPGEANGSGGGFIG